MAKIKEYRLNFIADEEMLFYIEDLKSKFSKINQKKYVLAYSGGKDSHRLFHLIKMWGFNDIEIVGINTYMEHREILDRINKNCDKVLLPLMKPFEIKEKYGIPCFSKIKDEFISRYQKGSRSKNTMKVINCENVYFNLRPKESELLLKGKLHKISNKCCDYLKKKPMEKYLKQVNKNSIIGIVKNESKLRDSKYKSCFTKNGKFVPMFDCTEEMADKIDEYFKIEIPDIYNYINRTGCMGCPYGKNWLKELDLIDNKNQKEFISEYFKESYKIR